MPTVESGDWNIALRPSAAAVSAGSLPFGLPQVLAIMTALAAFNPDAAATMQFINTELLDELAQARHSARPWSTSAFCCLRRWAAGI